MRVKGIIKKRVSQLSRYLNIIIFIVVYIALSLWIKELAMDNPIVKILGISIESVVLRGVITQLQMLISVYLVLKENKTGYIVCIILNCYSFIGAVGFWIHTSSPSSLPGVISYIGVLLIITLVIYYKNKLIDNIQKMENQNKILEESENKLHQMAFYDALTGLPNKELFMNRLEQGIYSAKRNGCLVGVMFVDLDSFKSVNDTMGHSAGDILLKKVAERFSSCIRKEDTVSRFGGDEFLFEIVNIQRVEDFITISNKVMNIFKQPIIVQNVELIITASAGMAIYPVDGEEPETLIKNADIAMYSAKNSGKNQCVFCSPEMKNDVVRKMKLTNKLYRALDNNELFLQYQPQINTATKEIIGFEALLRWNNDEFGMISPNVFIPLAESTGMIKPIGLWVFKTVCEQFKIIRESSNKNHRLSINLSLEQLKDVMLPNQISNILDDTKTNANDIQIEITESIASNEEPYVFQRIQELKKLGITIAIDDFGTGYSSLSRLRTFPIDLIKIDMEFVQGISTNSQKEKEITKSIVQLAKNLGIQVLAEGVETEEQYLFLRDIMCDEIQGFYFYKPMMPDKIKELISNIL